MKILRLTAQDDNTLTAQDDNTLTAQDDNTLTAQDDNTLTAQDDKQARNRHHTRRAMTRQSIHRTRGIAVLLAVLTLGALGARLAPRTSDVDEVWAMEDAYWRYVKAGDVEKYRTLWNDGFRGWPCHTEHPSTKATIGEWVQEIRDGKIGFDYKLTREGASNVGGVVVVFYQTPMIWKYADGRVDGRNDLPRKFTHTWMKVGGKWQIIGGMCGADAPRS